MRALGRLIVLPFAFLLASLVALFVVFSLGQERVVQGVAARAPDEAVAGTALELLRLGLSFLSVQALLPALLVVIVGEVARIRGMLYYVVGGGAALAVVPLLSRLQPISAPEVSMVVFQVLAVAGFAGGFVYWLLAGRNA
jgi:hypothetical protein